MLTKIVANDKSWLKVPSLRDLKNRIASVQSTKKLTSAMKMVAASKLRRAQHMAEAGRPYADRMSNIMASLVASLAKEKSQLAHRLLAGTGQDQVHLFVVFTSDRGLCGAFNASIIKETKHQVDQLLASGKTIKFMCIGNRGSDMLEQMYSLDMIIENIDTGGKHGMSFAESQKITRNLLKRFEDGEFDVAHVVYNHFKTAMSQVVTVQQVLPISAVSPETTAKGASEQAYVGYYEFEPGEEGMLADLLPRNVSVQVYKALLESAASEQGARMTAMDNATRNAGEMLDKLTLHYNRTRQAYITKELIEIISGVEAAS